MESNTLLFNLSEVLEYSKSGDFQKTATIEFSGPTMKTFDLSSKLSQLVLRAILDARDLEDKTKEVDVESDTKNIDANAMKIILLSSKSINFSDIANVCRGLFPKVGKLDDEVFLKDVHLDKISVEDFIRMICEYIVNFTFPSLF